MGFKNNYEQAQTGNELKPEGNYECIITAIEERTTKNGATGLNITLVIRNDIPNQKYGNACLFHTLWKRKEPNEYDKQVKGYGFGQVMALGRAAGLPDGKDYESLEQFCEELLHKCVRVTMKHEHYNEKTREKVTYVNPTEFPNCNHKFKQAPVKSGEFSNAQKNTAFANAPAAKAGNAAIGSLADFESALDDDDAPF